MLTNISIGRRKIKRVFDKFESMVTDLMAGIELLTQRESDNDSNIADLVEQNRSIRVEVETARNMKDKIETLIGG